jgi:hypothetical protein
MNLAIIIGISKYLSQQSLPSCKNDANYIKNILEKTSKFDELLFISDNTESKEIMKQIDELVGKYDGQEVNDILIYFSGHGIYQNDDFYFGTTDIDVNSINATSISNSNLDHLIKKLSPKSYIKIIDACESGAQYIKGSTFTDQHVKQKILEKSKSYFDNCYFFSSSSNNQVSYADETISSFTKSLIEILMKLIIDKKSEEIKYRDLSNELSDYFNDNPMQKPFFVIQGTLGEIFFTVNNAIYNYLSALILNNDLTVEDATCTYEISDFVDQLSKKVASKEKAYFVKEELSKSIVPYIESNTNDTLKNYGYFVNVDDISNDDVFNKKKIGIWVEENKENTGIFAGCKYTRDYSKNGLLSLTQHISSQLGGSNDAPYVISGFLSNANDENTNLNIELSSETHLPKYCCQIVTLFSLAKIFILYSFYECVPKNWDEYEEYDFRKDSQLKIIDVNILDKIDITKAKFENVLNEFLSYSNGKIKNYLDILNIKR